MALVLWRRGKGREVRNRGNWDNRGDLCRPFSTLDATGLEALWLCGLTELKRLGQRGLGENWTYWWWRSR